MPKVFHTPTLMSATIAAVGNARERIPTPTFEVISTLLLGRHALVTWVEAIERLELSELYFLRGDLYAAQGLRNDEIASRLDTPRQIVSKWRKRFFRERLAGLEDRPRRGRPSGFSPSGRGGGQGTGV